MMAQMAAAIARPRASCAFYGLDLSVAAQLGNYLWRLVRLDLGSPRSTANRRVGHPRAAATDNPADDRVAVVCVLLRPAIRRDRGARRQPLAGHADLDARLDLLRHASFWFGLMAIVVFSIYLQWLPAGGFQDIGTVQTGSGASSISPATWCCRR